MGIIDSVRKYWLFNNTFICVLVVLHLCCFICIRLINYMLSVTQYPLMYAELHFLLIVRFYWPNNSYQLNNFFQFMNHSVFFFMFQVNANGSVMSSDIVGSIKLKTMLSGMPELRLGLNDRVLFALSGRTYVISGKPYPFVTAVI